MPYDSDQLDNLDDELDALTTPTSLDVLLHSRDYDAGFVAATAVRRAIESVGGSGPPTGGAGGVLGGNYPNPSFAVDMATQAEVDALSSVYQPLDSDLTAFAGLSIAADKLPYGNGTHTMALADLTAAGRALLDDADAAAQRVTLGVAAALITENVQTASYTLALTDAGKRVVMNVGSANDLTVPTNGTVAFPIGTTIEVFQLGAGQTTLVMTSLTSQSPSGKKKLTGQYSSATLAKRDTDTWSISGDLAA